MEELHSYDWAGETVRRVGTVTHAFLQRIAMDGLAKWDVERVDRALPAIRTALVSEGVGPSKMDEAANKVASALRNTISDEWGRKILGARDQARSEYAVTASIDGTARRMKIDRTFVEGNVRWIVDFKTSDIEGGDRERFFQQQVTKYRDDLARYAAALRNIDGREVQCALYFPLQKEFRRVPLD